MEKRADNDLLQVHTACFGNRNNLEEGDEKPSDTE